VKSQRGKLNISLIGAGKVGTALAVLLHRSGHRIVSVISASKRSARTCARRVRCRIASDDVADIPFSSNLIIIAVPDEWVHAKADALAGLAHLDFKKLSACHTSGVLCSAELRSVSERGARIFSFHPIQTFPTARSLKEQLRSMKGITYGIEGPRTSISFARKLARALGGDALVVPKEAKILYHVACVFASNYSVVLLAAIEEVGSRVGLKGLKPFRKLIETSIRNAFEIGPTNALTGPIMRGSAETIARHLSALVHSPLRGTYKELAKYALRIAEKNKSLNAVQVELLSALLK
jgi:predicted short-subunit dehydrogenase-like oxidoreductase (DUF2520 family)